ncbi:MAG: flagellar biosynthesis protein FlhA [Armatimonadetes bacterium]|nr:flagellar biosynthesis protein FlhA [Armatimonadota bacterium]
MNGFTKVLKHTDLLLGLALLIVVAMLILPLPHFILDAGLVVAIATSVMILLMATNVSDPLQFSTFPSLLLVTTLFRLALSIAATKLILGSGQAGQVIQTFGTFVMGGDFVVGFVAFLILIIVNFVVITNGAGRVSEVVARFTLDAMPGKQMAIDADLAAGLIDEDQARERRKAVKQEADFYGAMDGASKFVKGDAIASVMIIAINILGGFAVGIFKGQSDPMTILKTYALLSVGEGLVSQMPALLISVASGLLVTRAGQDTNMGGQVAKQFMAQHKAIGVAGVALCGFGLVPGFPSIIFFGAGAACILLYRFLEKNPTAMKVFDKEEPKPKQAQPGADGQPAIPTGPEAVMPLLSVDTLEIEIGYGLTKLADPRVGGDLSDRVTATRRQIALDLGFVMPTVRIRDSVHLMTHEYVLKVRGEEVARGEVFPGQSLAVNSGAVISVIPGSPTKDPVFGLDALWIDNELREAGERAGFTVIAASAVISTHLAEVVKNYAAELLTRQEVQSLIDNAKKANQTVVDELVPNVLHVGDIQKVLQHLLRERVPIRDMVTILETMADFGQRVKDPDQLGELVRAAISRTITRQYVDHDHRLYCITLEPALERNLVENVSSTNFGPQLILDQDAQRRVFDQLQREMDNAISRGFQPVLLCSSQLRLPMRRMLDKQLPTLPVLAYNEVAQRAEVEFVGQVQAA